MAAEAGAWCRHGGKRGAAYLRHRACEVDFALSSVAYHHHFVELRTGGMKGDTAGGHAGRHDEHGGLHAHIAHLHGIALDGCGQGEAAVGVGKGRHALPACHAGGGADDAFAVFVDHGAVERGHGQRRAYSAK